MTNALHALIKRYKISIEEMRAFVQALCLVALTSQGVISPGRCTHLALRLAPVN